MGGLLHVNDTSIKIFLFKTYIEDKKKRSGVYQETPQVLQQGQLLQATETTNHSIFLWCDLPLPAESPAISWLLRAVGPNLPPLDRPCFPDSSYEARAWPMVQAGHHSCSLGNPHPNWVGLLQEAEMFFQQDSIWDCRSPSPAAFRQKDSDAKANRNPTHMLYFPLPEVQGNEMAAIPRKQENTRDLGKLH